MTTVAMIELFSYGFMQRAFIAGILIAIICGLVGIFIVLRRMSPIGDGLAHIAFGGIAIGMFAGIYPLGFALALCVLSVLGIQYLQNKKIYGEVGIAVFYAAGLAIGVILLSSMRGFTVDLFAYLFGNILAISMQDIYVISILAVIAIAFIAKYMRQLFYISFDEDAARVSGVNVVVLNTIFSILIAITVVLALRIMGILLVSALLVIPAATALQIGKSMYKTIFLSVGLSLLGVIGGLFSAYYFDIAASGAIILILVIFFFASVLIKK